MYHKIHPNSPTIWWVTVNDFYRQMFELQSKKVVYLDDYDVNNDDHVVITFDGIYKNVYEFALPILKHFNYPFELFITSDYIGLDNDFDVVEPNAPFVNVFELKQLLKYNGRIQWHTRSHINLSNVKDIELIKNELNIPTRILEIDNNGFKWFAYPHGEFNDVVINEVKKRFKGALSCNQGNEIDVYKLNRITVLNKTSFKKNTIACIIASYNYGHYLIEAIESVLRQTVVPDEIIISDDCSDDDTRLIGEIYVTKYPNLIRYNRNDINMGVVDHFNKVIKMTNSDYVFFLGADNRLLSNYVEECSSVLNNNDVSIVYTDFVLFGSRAKIAYDGFLSDFKKGVIDDCMYEISFPEFDSWKEQVDFISKKNFIHGSSMFKRTVFDEVGGYLKTDNPEDFNLFQRIINKGYKAKKAISTKLEYRQHSVEQLNNTVSLNRKMLLYKKMYLEKSDFEKSKFYIYTRKLYKFKRMTPKERFIFLKANIVKRLK